MGARIRIRLNKAFIACLFCIFAPLTQSWTFLPADLYGSATKSIRIKQSATRCLWVCANQRILPVAKFGMAQGAIGHLCAWRRKSCGSPSDRTDKSRFSSSWLAKDWLAGRNTHTLIEPDFWFFTKPICWHFYSKGYEFEDASITWSRRFSFSS